MNTSNQPSRSQTISFQPKPWVSLLRLANWEVKLSNSHLTVLDKNNSKRWLVLDAEIKIHKGWLGSRIEITHANGQESLRGWNLDQATQLRRLYSQAQQKSRSRLQADLQSDLENLQSISSYLIENTINHPYYLAARDKEKLSAFLSKQANAIGTAMQRANLSCASSMKVGEEVRALANTLEPYTAPDYCLEMLSKRNEEFVEAELRNWQSFFDYCEARPLTEEQAKAAITFEENTLLVAAAGSGKTSTVVGKVAYALSKGIVRPNEVLCLAFNSKAAAEIGTRIKERLNAIVDNSSNAPQHIKDSISKLLKTGCEIESCTFHALGKNIITQHEKTPPRISVSEIENNQRMERAIEECQTDPQFQANWILFQTVFRSSRPQDSRFTNEAEYLEYLKSVWQQRKQKEGILSLGSNSPVKSFEEVTISNWLYVMGVEFKYEAEFPEGANILCPGESWTPDFTYKVIDEHGEHTIIHEHFALNRQGKAPGFFKDPNKYASDAKRKKEVLEKLDSRHFWTTSAEYMDGTILESLENKLRDLGVKFNPRSTDEILKRLNEIGLIPDNDLIKRAVSQIRQNGWSLPTLKSRIADQPEKFRATLFLNVVWPLAEKISQLMKSKNMLDYDAMIQRALHSLNENPGLLPYKFILVDEFQDTAPGRGKMVKMMLQAKPDSYLFAVGDDWQAINRFAGSDLQFFQQFGKKFNNRPLADRRCDLTQTFRSNQGIADVARHFILKNKSQLPKIVHASDTTSKGVINILTYRNNSDVVPKIEATLETWVKNHPIDKKPSVFLLGRYGVSYIPGLDKSKLDELRNRWEGRLELISIDEKDNKSLYLTMHKSKGLEADYVLILGMFNVLHDWFCFPSEREDDPLLQMILPPREALADADERRLFYVALTRAKRQAALLVQESYPSQYAIELMRDHRDGKILFNGSTQLPQICPSCTKGLMFKRHNPNKQKEFLACTNRYGCGKTLPYPSSGQFSP